MNTLTRVFAIVSLFAAAAGIASVVVTRGPYVLRDTGAQFPTEDECLTAAQAGLADAERPCDHTASVKGFCDDVPAPPDPAERVLDTHDCPPGSDLQYWFTEDHQVRTNVFPSCWALRPVVQSGCKLLPTSCAANPSQCYTPAWPQ